MANMLDKVKTIFLLMFENRSFDHMLGHLSLEGLTKDVDGLTLPLNKFSNIYGGDTYSAYQIIGDSMLPSDLPHEWFEVRDQLARSTVTNRITMSGFVKTYAEYTGLVPNTQCQPMGFFSSPQVPITSFLAKTFCTCDRFFTTIPTSTQPNRTVAFFGDTNIYTTKTRLIGMHNSIFDWLESNNIRWRVYHDGLSFFALYPSQWKHIFGKNFRDFEYLGRDMLQEPEETAPQVVLIEPSYQSSPHIGSDRPNDNHAPLAVGWGEEFLRRSYEAVTSNKERWENSVMVVYYDEHGGFYDHVPPPPMEYTTLGDDTHTFDTLGPRIPGIIASPMVKPASVNHLLFDHTSVLQLLADKFTPGRPYNNTVQKRKEQGIQSIAAALTNDTFWEAPPPPSIPIFVQTALGKTIETAPTTDLEQSFELAANTLIEEKPVETGEKYPELFQWKKAVENARGKPAEG